MSTEIASTPQHPSSTLVNISADADLRLIKLLAPTTSSPSQFESTCSDHIANGDAAGLVKAIVAEEGAIGGLFSGEYTVEEAVGAVCLLGALLERVGDETLEGELCASLADVVARAAAASASNEDGSAEKGSACVAALFNLRSNGVEKVRLLTKIVDLADTSSLAPGAPEGYSALADMLESSMLQSSLTLWGGRNDDNSIIPDGEQRALFQAVVRGMDRVLAKLTGDKKGDEAASVEVEVARKIKAAVDRKQTYLMLILETYKEESQIDNEALAYAQAASIGAIREPINLFSSQQRLLHLPAISALQKQKSTVALYDLLKIFHEGKLQDYRDFTSMPDKSSVFAAFQLNEGECMKNMCLLSLVSLAGEHEEIPYSAVASTLDIAEDQVEKWVILGVSSGLMEAKMDQLSKVVIVERCVVRQFGSTEWEALKVRLDKWKTNVRGVLDALKKSGAGVAIDIC
ncbi:predicted protein [Thalassiosira pseudonana CCMP1335]|uniref:Eukaryotic translation initiation factor 3 subunit M n=1 Tax=Thalassiosira pseudonana TaxID=35128 RepID=B8C1E6_THAPS|nr:predicted protein [Thalassiosira pseudonana CCMP1335]EED93228.1 predicted protein [Thalassiosira pseudonana CCMP1335]